MDSLSLDFQEFLQDRKKIWTRKELDALPLGPDAFIAILKKIGGELPLEGTQWKIGDYKNKILEQQTSNSQIFQEGEKYNPSIAYIKQWREQQKREERLNSTVETMYENHVVISEHITFYEDQRWTKLYKNIIGSTFRSFDTEVHYLNLDLDPTHEGYSKVHFPDNSKSRSYYRKKYGHAEHQKKYGSRVISLIIRRPKNASMKTPVGIFTHGGAQDFFFLPIVSVNPILAAFSGLGYTTVALNHHSEIIENYLEDMNAVLAYLPTLDFIDSSKMVLSGISNGTRKNASIIDKIGSKLGGIFFHTGYYDLSTPLPPLSLPVFIVHGKEDQKAPHIDFLKYRDRLEKAGNDVHSLSLVDGEHHLITFLNKESLPSFIDPLSQNDFAKHKEIIENAGKRYNTESMKTYISKLVIFLDKIAYGDMPMLPSYKYEKIPGTRHWNPETQITVPHSTSKEKEMGSRALILKAQTSQIVKTGVELNQKFPTIYKMWNTEFLTEPSRLVKNERFQNAPYTFSTAHLKVILGKDYMDALDDRSLKKNIEKFLIKYDGEMKSICAEYLKADPDDTSCKIAAQKVASQDEFLKNLIFEILKKEIEYKGSYVLYHGADSKTGFLYDVYSALRRLLTIQAIPGDNSAYVTRLRLLDEAFKDILSARDLVEKMEKLRASNPHLAFNYLPGYQPVGLSAQWFLFGSYKYWFNSTFFRYFRENGTTDKSVEISLGIKSLLTAFGVKNNEHINYILNKYTSLYKNNYDEKNSILLQMFISPDIIDKVTYLSEVMGFPLKLQLQDETSKDFTPSRFLPEALFDPINFEKTLMKNRENFKHQTYLDRQTFFQNNPDYINMVESRFLMLPNCMDGSNIEIKKYSCNPPHPSILRKIEDLGVETLTKVFMSQHSLNSSLMAEEIPLVKLSKYVQSHFKEDVPPNEVKQNDVSPKSQEFGELLLKAIHNIDQEGALFYIQGGANIDAWDSEMKTPLIWASTKGFLDVVKALIAKKIENEKGQVNAEWNIEKFLDWQNRGKWTPQRVKMTALQYAIENKHSDVALELIKAGANVNVLGDQEGIPIQRANYHGLTEVVLDLSSKSMSLLGAIVSKDIDKSLKLIRDERGIDARDANNNTPLILAAQNGLKDVVHALLNVATTHNYINLKNNNNLNALLWATMNKHSEIAIDLINAGAHMDVPNCDGERVLDIAMRNRLKDVILTILQENIKYEGRLKEFLSHKDDKGITDLSKVLTATKQGILTFDEVKEHLGLNGNKSQNALSLAIKTMDLESAITLIQAGANTDIIISNELPLLIWASLEGLTDVVEAIITKKRETLTPDAFKKCINLTHENIHILLWSLNKGHSGTALTLITAGTNLDVMDKQGNTPLMLAVQHGLMGIVKTLVEKKQQTDPDTFKAYLDKKSQDQTNVLLQAIMLQKSEIALFLMEVGANINVISGMGRTPLTWASNKGLTEVVKVLLIKNENQKDPGNLKEYLDRKDKEKNNALLYATMFMHTEIALMLINAGANINVIDDNNDFTPLMRASQKGLTEVVKALITKKTLTEPGSLKEFLNRNNLRQENALQIATKLGKSDIALLLTQAYQEVSSQAHLYNENQKPPQKTTN